MYDFQIISKFMVYLHKYHRGPDETSRSMFSNVSASIDFIDYMVKHSKT